MRRTRPILLLVSLFALIADDAWAVIGRPLTPASGAGVARRTVRRTTRRAVMVTSMADTPAHAGSDDAPGA